MSIGRNDPCPCGSGKKYKKCCLNEAPEPVQFVKEKVDRFHAEIIPKLLRHAKEVFGPDAFDAAADEFFCWPEKEDEPEEIGPNRHETVFYPWFLFKWSLEEDEEEDFPGVPREQIIVHSYLRSHGKKLAPLEQEYLEAYAAAPLSFFQIIDVQPGKSVAVRDLFLECDYKILEHTASRTLREGDVLYGSVVEVGGVALFGALSMIHFLPVSKISILQLQDTMLRGAGRPITRETLEDYDLEIRDLYLYLFDLRTTPPTLLNTDGDRFCFHTLKYDISSPRKVFDALKDLTNGFVAEDELLEDAEYDRQGRLRGAKIPWLVPDKREHGAENILYGELVIRKSDMTCELNSAERASRLRSIIEERLSAKDASYRTTVIQSVDSMMRNPPATPPPTRQEEDFMSHPEVQARLEEYMRKHWETWPDTKLPALNGKTPRQAVRSKLGRRMVEALLEDAEKMCRENERTSNRLEHVQMVRRELGL